MTAEEHLVLLSGIGGPAATGALPQIAAVTRAVSVVHVRAWTPGDAVRAVWDEHGFSGEFVEVDDLDGVRDAALALAGRRPVHGVATYSELLLRPQAEIAEALGLPGNPVAAVACAQSKALQRAAFADAGLSSPRHVVVRAATELDAAAARVGFPAVLKPSLGAGSVGVRTVRSATELRAAWDRIAEQPTAFLQHDPSAVLEARLPVDDGHEPGLAGYCSVESLVRDGAVTTLGISDRLRLRHDCVEEGLVFPSSMGPDLAARVIACAERAIRAVGLRHGATHVEIATGDDHPQPIEVNARVGGPVCSMVAAATGRSLVADIAALALGRPVPPLPPSHATAWFRFVPVPEGDWRIAAQAPAAELLTRFPQLVYLRPRFEVGGHVTLARTQHLASFLVAAPDRAAAATVAAEVERALGIDLQPVAALR